MDRSDQITLVSVTQTQDEIGQIVKVESERLVYCDKQSVSQNEFFQAHKQGLNAQYQVIMFRYDYNGEQIAIIDGVRYGIYRTYIKRNDEIELYLEEKQGVTYEEEEETPTPPIQEIDEPIEDEPTEEQP